MSNFDPKASEPCLNIDISNVAYCNGWEKKKTCELTVAHAWSGYVFTVFTIYKILSHLHD